GHWRKFLSLCAEVDLLRIGGTQRQRVRLLCRGSWLTIGLCFGSLRVVLPEQAASSLCKSLLSAEAVRVPSHAIRCRDDAPSPGLSPVSVCRRAALPLFLEGIMTPPATAIPVELPPAFTQRYQLPEMLARVLAGRDVGIDEVEDFLDPTIRKLMPDPHTVTTMETAARRIADAAV